MKRIGLVVVLLLSACGDDPGCEISVDSVGDVMPNKHVTIMGNFTSGQPLVLLQGTDGSNFRQIPCTSADDNLSADCDLSAYPSGMWELGFAVSCLDGAQGGVANYDGAKMITIP